MCDGAILARPRVPERIWTSEIAKLAQQTEIDEVYAAQVHGMNQLPKYRDVPDGAMGGFFTVKEGQCNIAAEMVAEKTKRYPYRMLTRMSVMDQLPLLMRQGITYPGLGVAISAPLPGQTALPILQTGLRAYISFVAVFDSLISELNKLYLLTTGGTVDLLGGEDGGPFMRGLLGDRQVHCVLRTRVDSQESGWALWAVIKQSDQISYPVAFVELPKEAAIRPFIPPDLTARTPRAVA